MTDKIAEVVAELRSDALTAAASGHEYIAGLLTSIADRLEQAIAAVGDRGAVVAATLIHSADEITKVEISTEGMGLGYGSHKLYTEAQAIAVVVDEAMVLRACNAYDRTRNDLQNMDTAAEYPAMWHAIKAALQEPSPCDMGKLCLNCQPRRADGSCPDSPPKEPQDGQG